LFNEKASQRKRGVMSREFGKRAHGSGPPTKKSAAGKAAAATDRGVERAAEGATPEPGHRRFVDDKRRDVLNGGSLNRPLGRRGAGGYAPSHTVSEFFTAGRDGRCGERIFSTRCGPSPRGPVRQQWQRQPSFEVSQEFPPSSPGRSSPALVQFWHFRRLETRKLSFTRGRSFFG
jgi:hypothetical protein